MQQGELILRNPGRDEGYWMALLLLTGGLWVALEQKVTQDVLLTITCVLLVAAAVLRLTVLRRWHLYTLPWTLNDERLTLGDREIPLKEIDSVGLKTGMVIKGSLFLIIKGRQTIRLAALVRGRDQKKSEVSIREMGWALKQTIDRLDGKDQAEEEK